MHLSIVVLRICIQAVMNLNRLAFCTLDNCMARSFLWSICGTHARLCLDGALRSSVQLGNLDMLVPVLRASLPCNSVACSPVPTLSTILHHHWGTQSYLWSTAHYRPRCRKPFCSNGGGLILFLFHDNCGLVTRPDVLYFLHSLSTAGVAPQVSNLPDVTSGLGSALHVVEDDVFDFMQLLARIRCGSLSATASIAQIIWLYERMLLHEKGLFLI